MILDSTTEKITLVLAGATTTTPGDCDAAWTTSDHAGSPTFDAGSNSPQTNGTTSVDLVPVPTSATMRVSVQDLSVVNRDTQPMTVTIRKTDTTGPTHRVVFGPCVLQVGEKIQYSREDGWTVFNVDGAKKVTAVANTAAPGFINGFKMVRSGTSSLDIGSGTAYIQSIGANINLPAAITKAGLSLSASTFHHAYLYLNAGVPDVEVVTTAPASPYFGTARSKTGDTSRRYLGSILTDASSAIIEFDHSPESRYVSYRFGAAGAAPYRVLSGGSATVPTNISLSGAIPTTGVIGLFRGINTSTTGAILFFANSTYSGASQQLANVQTAPSGSTFTVELPMPCPAQVVAYTAATGGAFLDVKGYIYER